MFPCIEPRCDKAYNRSADLKRHQHTHRPAPESPKSKKIPCPFSDFGCTFSAPLQKKMDAHVATAHKSKGKMLPCPDDPTCMFATTSAGALALHRKARHGYIPMNARGRGANHPPPPAAPLSLPLPMSGPSHILDYSEPEYRGYVPPPMPSFYPNPELWAELTTPLVSLDNPTVDPKTGRTSADLAWGYPRARDLSRSTAVHASSFYISHGLYDDPNC